MLDLRTVWPFDGDAVLESLGQTSRLLVLQEAPRSSGVAGQILSLVAREGFELLDAPPALVAPPDTPVPFAPELEDAYLPSVRPCAPPRGAPWLLSRPSRRGRAADVAPRRGSSCCRLMLLQRARRGADHGALPPGPHRRQRLHRATGRRRSPPAPGSRSGRTTSSRRSTASRPATTHAACRSPTCCATSSARPPGPTCGRDGNMHFGVPRAGVFPLVSMLGDLVPVAVGRRPRLQAPRRAAGGDDLLRRRRHVDGRRRTRGSTSRRVWHVPAVFVIQSNRYAYSTPTERQMVNTRHLRARSAGGWCIPAPRSTAPTRSPSTRSCARRSSARVPDDGPHALEALTLRGHGHAAHDGALYVPTSCGPQYADPIERLAVRLGLDGLPRVRSGARAAEEVASGARRSGGRAGPGPGDARGRNLCDASALAQGLLFVRAGNQRFCSCFSRTTTTGREA